MSEAIHRPHAPSGARGAAVVYSHFGFYKIDPAYRRLLPNEKVVAKQELLSAVETFDDRLQLYGYSLLGLRADCDLLLWRVGPDLETLQEMAARTLPVGLGKYLSPTHSLLGAWHERAPRQDELGKERFLFLQPLVRGDEWRKLPAADKKRLIEEEVAAAKAPGATVHAIPAFGLDDPTIYLAVETARPQDLPEIARALEATQASRYNASGGTTFACIRHEFRDILDQLG